MGENVFFENIVPGKSVMIDVGSLDGKLLGCKDCLNALREGCKLAVPNGPFNGDPVGRSVSI